MILALRTVHPQGILVTSEGEGFSEHFLLNTQMKANNVQTPGSREHVETALCRYIRRLISTLSLLLTFPYGVWTI